MTLRRLLIISDGLVNSDRDYGGYYRGDEVDAEIRQRDDVIAEMGNRIEALEAAKATLRRMENPIPKNLIEVKRNVEYLQAFGCRLCIHIGTVAVLFGRKSNGRGPRVELFTPRHWFRWSKGFGG